VRRKKNPKIGFSSRVRQKEKVVRSRKR
jgi:hypothetical protein